jgi:hypothetical protein
MNETAFPYSYEEQTDGTTYTVSYPGMTLRDYFAAKALACLGHPQDSGDAEVAARFAYKVADAMLKERGR